MGDGKCHLLTAVAGFVVSAEAAQRGRFRASQKNFKIRNQLSAMGRCLAPQQGFVPTWIDLDDMKSFEQGAHLLRRSVRPTLKRRALSLDLSASAHGDFPNPAAQLVAADSLPL